MIPRITLLLFFLLVIRICFAQPVSPFSKLNFQVGAVSPFYISSPYKDYYHARLLSPRLQAGANFFNGEITASIAFHDFNADTLPSFGSTLFLLGYQYNIALVKNVWLKPGLAFGNNFMVFRDVNINNTSHITESELLFEGSIALQAKLHKTIHASISASFQRTMLYHHFDQANVSLMLLYYFNTPGLVKKIIE